MKENEISKLPNCILFSKKEFRSNISALKNLRKANSRLAKVSEGLISDLAAVTSDKTL